MQKLSYSHFFSKNISIYAIFNDMLTNDIVSFKQLDPGVQQEERVLIPLFNKGRDQPAH